MFLPCLNKVLNKINKMLIALLDQLRKVYMTSFCRHSFNSEILISFRHFLFGCAHKTASVECITINQFLNVIRSVIHTNLYQFCVLSVKRTFLDQVCVCYSISCKQYLISCAGFFGQLNAQLLISCACHRISC